MLYSENQKHILLNLARDSIREYAIEAKTIVLSKSFLKIHQFLLDRRACFVTLYYKDELRGCIGTVSGECSLYENIIRYAIYAATKDDRFVPITRDELKKLQIEISVLTPKQRMLGSDDFIIGKDGLIIEKDRYSGLLLPQVAIEWGFSKREFLEQLCLKADLKCNAYKELDSVLYKFSAEIVR